MHEIRANGFGPDDPDGDESTDGGAEAWRTVEQRSYDPDGDAELTTVVVEAVAAAEGVDATAVTSPPLYEAVDVTAIEEGFFARDVAGSSRDSTGSIDFHYRGFRVTVDSDGWVRVAEPVEG